MKFLEKDLEEIIYETYKENRRKLCEKNLFIDGEMKRQLRIGNYGIADLVTIERDYNCETDYDYVLDEEKETEDIILSENLEPKLVVTIYELKKEKIGVSAFLQAINYAKGIKDYFDKRCFKFEVEIHIALIGKELDTSGSFCFLPSVMSNLRFYTYEYGIDGIIFKREHGYQLTNKGF